MKLAGVGFVKETRRYYPRRELAGQLLGIVGDDGEGLEGVEKAWDESLQGEGMRLPSLRDARGAHLLGAGPAPERVLEGARVELTIDQGLQNAAERALVQAVAQARAASGMAVVIDPATGEILALATAPLLNPNAPAQGGPAQPRRPRHLRGRARRSRPSCSPAPSTRGPSRPTDAIFCENGRWAVGKHTSSTTTRGSAGSRRRG